MIYAKNILYAMVRVFLTPLLFYYGLYGQQESCVAGMRPSQVEFAWDLHDVLIQGSTSAIIRSAINNAGRHGFFLAANVVGDCFKYVFTGRRGSALTLVDKMQTLGKSGAGASGYAQVLGEYDQELEEVVLKIMRAYGPIPGIEELIEELGALGYTHRIATNEGKKFFEDQKKRHPALFKHFKEGMTTDYAHVSRIIKKPSVEYFENFQKRYNAGGDKKIIFIDDKKANVESSLKAGMIGIHFENVEQLRQDLREAGIPVAH